MISNNKRELKILLSIIQQILIITFYRKCTSKLYSFWTIDTVLPADNPLRFRKHFLRFIVKVTLTDETKVIKLN